MIDGASVYLVAGASIKRLEQGAWVDALPADPVVLRIRDRERRESILQKLGDGAATSPNEDWRELGISNEARAAFWSTP